MGFSSPGDPGFKFVTIYSQGLIHRTEAESVFPWYWETSRSAVRLENSRFFHSVNLCGELESARVKALAIPLWWVASRYQANKDKQLEDSHGAKIKRFRGILLL